MSRLLGVAWALELACRQGRADSAAGGTSQNIFGDPLDICFQGAPGYRDSCPFGDPDLTKSMACVQPSAAVQANPFCLDLAKFGKYLALQAMRSTSAAVLEVKCNAVPEEVMYSDIATEHFLDKAYGAIADHVCKRCGMEGVLSPGPADWCWAIAQGTTTTTVTWSTSTLTTTLPAEMPGMSSDPAMPFKPAEFNPEIPLPHFNFKIPLPTLPPLPEAPTGPHVFWPAVLTFGICWCAILAWFGVCRCQADDNDSSSDGEHRSARLDLNRRPQALFAGAWESLGQTHVITDTELRWEDRKVSHIDATDKKAFKVVLNGRTEEAVLDDSGHRLVWSNGSVWARPEEGAPLLGAGAAAGR